MSRKKITVILAAFILAGVVPLRGEDVLSPQTRVPAEDTPGCLSCHEGIAIIDDKMQPHLLDFAQDYYGKRRGYECAICHEGDPTTDENAHEGLIPNPSSMWVLHQGKGCAKCHDSEGSVATVMGKPLSVPVGGELLSVTVDPSDPSGETGGDYTYRMSRALMSLEAGPIL